MLAPVESLWCQYLDASTQATYPVRSGDKRVTLLNSSKAAPSLYQVTVLVEVWADRSSSETDALALHSQIELADSQYRLGASVYGVSVQYPIASPDPDTELDRYQMLVTHFIRTITNV